MGQQTIPAKQNSDCGVSHCIHCGKECAQGESFCCNGCEAAYKISKPSPKHAKKPSEKSEGFEVFVQQNEQDFEITLQVEGMHCAACMVLIENALNAEKNVINARVNFSTKRLRLQWQGKKQDIIEGKEQNSSDHNQTAHDLTISSLAQDRPHTQNHTAHGECFGPIGPQIFQTR